MIKIKWSFVLALIIGVVWANTGYNIVELGLIVMALVSGILLEKEYNEQ